MVNIETFRKLALSFPEATEQPHFKKLSFRVKKKIFATLDIESKEVVLKFSAVKQSVFCAIDFTIIQPVNGTWGKQGWTIIYLKNIKKNLLKDALTNAYCEVAPKKLGRLLMTV